jgi:hypothetical protein
MSVVSTARIAAIQASPQRPLAWRAAMYRPHQIGLSGLD